MKFVAVCGCGLTMTLERASYIEAVNDFRKMGWEFTVDGKDWCKAHNTVTGTRFVLQLPGLEPPPATDVERLQSYIDTNETELVRVTERRRVLLAESQELQQLLITAQMAEQKGAKK